MNEKYIASPVISWIHGQDMYHHMIAPAVQQEENAPIVPNELAEALNDPTVAKSDIQEFLNLLFRLRNDCSIKIPDEFRPGMI